MIPLAIRGGLTPQHPHTNSAHLAIVDGRVHPDASAHSTAAIEIDATDLLVAPGFIDIQINGAFGHDLVDDPMSLWKIGRALPQHGVTAFLPTIITSPSHHRTAMLAALAERPTDHVGAEPIGTHFEGPMLSPERRGAHRAQFLQPPTRALIEGWSRHNGVSVVTIAPEEDGALSIIGELRDRGVVVSLGHSDANSAEARAGFDAGATAVTHLFNAMAPFGHRAPGLVGATLADRAAYASLIVDGIHLDPQVVRVAWRALGPQRVVLITDAVAAMGQPAGTYTFDERTIVSDGTTVRNADGALAGSVLTMDQAVRNLCTFAGCDPWQALAAASSNPAQLIRADGRGSLDAGAIADIVLLDHNLNVQITICRGRVAFVADSARGRFTSAGTV